MSRVCEPVRVETTGRGGHGYGLRFSDPRPTHTRDTGMVGFVLVCYSHQRVVYIEKAEAYEGTA